MTKEERTLIGMMTVMLVVTGVAGGVTVPPVVVAEEGNGKVTLRYDLPMEAGPWARPAVADRENAPERKQAVARLGACRKEILHEGEF